MNHYQHPQAIVESQNIGKGTRIWAFAHVLPGAIVGDECNICDHTFIENDVYIGHRVTIKCGVQLWDGVTLEDDVFVGPNATFTNDRFPRSKQYPEKFLRTIVRQGASIGANATILPGVEIGRGAMIGAGSVITRNVPPHAIVVGNPGRIVGYEPVGPTLETRAEETADKSEDLALPVKGVRLFHLPLIHDLRGDLSFAQFPEQLPFVPQRYFLVFDVSSKEIRGEHAHRTLHQFLVCVTGSCAVVVDDGACRTEVNLNQRHLGLYLPPMVWGIQYKFSRDAVLMVLASDVYRGEDYIRDYDEFLAIVQGKQQV